MLYGVGWGWDANVHVQLRPKWMLRYMGWGEAGMLTFMCSCARSGCYAIWGGVGLGC